MTLRTVLIACAVVLCTAGAGHGDEPAPGMDIEISLTELAEEPGTYDAVAIVHAAEDGRLLAAPHLRIRGDQTSVVAVDNAAGDRISLSIGPVFRRQQAQWLVVWRRNGETIARSQGQVEVFGKD